MSVNEYGFWYDPDDPDARWEPTGSLVMPTEDLPATSDTLPGLGYITSDSLEVN